MKIKTKILYLIIVYFNIILLLIPEEGLFIPHILEILQFWIQYLKQIMHTKEVHFSSTTWNLQLSKSIIVYFKIIYYIFLIKKLVNWIQKMKIWKISMLILLNLIFILKEGKFLFNKAMKILFRNRLS